MGSGQSDRVKDRRSWALDLTAHCPLPTAHCFGRLQRPAARKAGKIVTRRVRQALERVLPEGWYVDSQEPITLSDSEPEPDVRVARAEVADDPKRYPGPQDVALVVEVADISLRRDRGTKKRIYARAGIPVYWIANLPERRFEVYTEPTGPATRGPAPAAGCPRSGRTACQDAAPPPDYRQHQEYGPAEEIPVVLAGNEIGRLPVRDLLP